ncbi:MAG: tetratricopeptide repeat protein [Deltaproteobacteria bacterium]|nr:tetratricopeptide repeat protein [Deltaproteobacteria bacterium]
MDRGLILSTLPWIGAGLFLIIFSFTLLFRNKARKVKAAGLLGREIDISKSDPRFALDNLDDDESLAMSAKSVKTRPRTLKEIITLPDSRSSKELSKAIDKIHNKPRTEDAFEQLGLALAHIGLIHSAALAFRRAVEYHSSSNSYYYLGLCFKSMGKTRWAIESLKASINCHRGFAAAHSLLGYLYMEEEDLSEAAVHLARAMSLDPERPEPHLGLAWIHSTRNEVADSEFELEAVTLCGDEWLDAAQMVKAGVRPAKLLDWSHAFYNPVQGENNQSGRHPLYVPASKRRTARA